MAGRSLKLLLCISFTYGHKHSRECEYMCFQEGEGKLGRRGKEQESKLQICLWLAFGKEEGTPGSFMTGCELELDWTAVISQSRS